MDQRKRRVVINTISQGVHYQPNKTGSIREKEYKNKEAPLTKQNKHVVTMSYTLNFAKYVI